MIWRRNKIDKEMIRATQPTSKSALKMQCLLVAKGDIDKAERLYDFMSKGLEDLPTFDNIPPTTMQQVKDGAINTFNWLNENQEQVMNWIAIIKDMFNKGGGNIPPTSTPLPPIN
jgi:hypothetical protein